MDFLKTTLWFILLLFSVGKLNCTNTTRIFSYVQETQGKLNCLDTENIQFEIITPESKVNLPNIASLTIPSCQFLKTTVIHQLINNIQLEELTRLEFNFKNNNEIALSSYDFSGLNLKEFTMKHVQYVEEIKNSTEVDVNETTLPIELLQSRDKLQVLRLSVGLTTLSRNLLSNLTNLKRLYLQNNELVMIPPAAVKNLEHLESIDLSHNKLRYLIPQQFPYLHRLKYVNLSSNEISIISFNVFKDNINLEIVDLQNNPLSNLPQYLFAYLSTLVEVNLRHCKLTNLPILLFYQSRSMMTLDLSFNEITSIEEFFFHSLEKLSYLDLSSNQLSGFPKVELKNLKYLNLSSNNLTSLEKIKIESLTSLENLDLNCNQLTSMTLDFRYAKNFSYINLSHNNLKELALLSFSLKKIDVSYNNLTTIGEWIFLNRNLEYLDASYNKIVSLSIDSFMQLTRISTLNLSNNRISLIEFFTLELLTERQSLNQLVIKLNKNPIKCDCHLTSLVKYFEKSLNSIIRNRIIIKSDKLVCESPENLKNQLVKNLNSSKLTCPYDHFYAQDCPDVCDCYVRLWDDAIIVDCEKKNLTEVPVLNLPQSNIVEVNLQNNFLTSGPLDFMGYENVTKLLLANNNIKELTWTPPRLKTLTLDHNNLTVFDNEIMESLESPYLLNVSLGSNPWVCNCSTKILKTFLSEYSPSKSIDAEDITCIKDGSKIIDLGIDDLCELSYLDKIVAFANNLPYLNIISATLGLILTIVLLVYMYRVHISIRKINL